MTSELYPQALQELNKKGDKVTRWAVCPTHAKRTTKYMGEQISFEGRRFWTFKCEVEGTHIFQAVKPLGIPEKVEEVGKWVQGELKRRVEKTSS